MVVFYIVLAIVVIIAITLFFMSVRVVKQYERGVVLRFGRYIGTREPGLRFIIPIVDRMTRAWHDVVEHAAQRRLTLRLAATCMAVERVFRAHELRGLYP